MLKQLLLILLFSASVINAQTINIESELDKLDKLLEKKEFYLQQRIDSINSFKAKMLLSNSDEEKYPLLQSVISLYMPINADSTLHYSKLALNLSSKSGDFGKIAEAKLNMIQSHILMGMYFEALEELEKLNIPANFTSLKQREYELYSNLYSFLSIYSENNSEYQKKYHFYQKSMMEIYPEGSFSHNLAHANVLISNKKYNEAIIVLEKLLLEVNEKQRPYAAIAYLLSKSYAEQNNSQKQVYYLIKSAQSDIICGVKEYTSLTKLASILYKNEDLKRAYNYIRISLNDAIESNTQIRREEVIDILPLIDYAYQNNKEKQQRLYLYFFIVVTALMLILSINLFALRKQRRSLKISNREAKAYNEKLKELNSLLQKSENKLKEVNTDLEKDIELHSKYIAKYLKLSSSYIAKFDAYTKRLASKSSQLSKSEIVDELKSRTIIDQELKNFYREFDVAFLKLYPDFVDSYNKLMKEEAKIKLKSDELLNTELRIFALVRLGIDESNQIAEFLRYSPTTIYNYRTKARNNSVVGRENFKNAIMEID